MHPTLLRVLRFSLRRRPIFSFFTNFLETSILRNSIVTLIVIRIKVQDLSLTLSYLEHYSLFSDKLILVDKIKGGHGHEVNERDSNDSSTKNFRSGNRNEPPGPLGVASRVFINFETAPPLDRWLP